MTIIDKYPFLSICTKVFAKLLFDSICEFLDNNCLLNSK